MMFSQEFMRNALVAGSATAIASAVIGYFVVLRAQVFAGDVLAHVAFTGALAAALAGVDLRLGLFVGTVGVALLIAGLGEHARADDVTIGVALSWVLGLGALFLDLFNRGIGGGNGLIASRTLFGSIYDLGVLAAELLVVVVLVIVAAVAIMPRPLLFATLDAEAAAARGVPVRRVGAAFLVLVGLDAGASAQAVGALLLLGLLAAPAGAAIRLTASPARGVALAVLFALASTWGGLGLASVDATLPPSSAIVGIAAIIYAARSSRRR